MSAQADAIKPPKGGEAGWARRRVEGLGASVIDTARAARLLYSVFIRTLYYSVRGRREKGATLRACYQIRDFAASIGSMMLATRVGAGIAAEIGSMVVTDQVDALRMCAAEPVDYLIVPRFKASIVMTTVLLVWAMFVLEIAGMLTAWGMFGVNPRIFWNTSMVDYRDLVTGLTKCLAFGAAIPIVSGYCGLTTFGGAEGVGWATTRAVVWSCFATILLNFIISTITLYLFWA